MDMPSSTYRQKRGHMFFLEPSVQCTCFCSRCANVVISTTVLFMVTCCQLGGGQNWLSYYIAQVYVFDIVLWFAGMHLWRSKYSAFIHLAQMTYCRRLISVPLTTFHRLADSIGDPKGELTFLFHVPRAGSTLLNQVYDSIVQTIVL